MDFIKEQEQFCKFIKSFDSYLRPAYMIAQNNDDETILNVKKIGSHFKLYSLDPICQTRKIFRDGEINITPKTTDAIWCKKGNNDTFIIYLIEFKGDKIENKSTKYHFEKYLKKLNKKRNEAQYLTDKKSLEKVINNITPFFNKYSDSLLNSLVLKPLETVTISLPLIYEDYYNANKDKEDVKKIDVTNFLKRAIIKYYVVLFPDDNPEIDEEKEINEYDPWRTRQEANIMGDMIVESSYDYNELTKSYKNNLISFYERYKKANIINEYDFMPTNKFNEFVKVLFEKSN